MFGRQIRAAREEAGLSRDALAALANIARSNLQTLEQDGNVTLSTLAKVLPHLPRLRWLTLGGVDLMVVDGTTRRAITDLLAIAEHLAKGVGQAPRVIPASGATEHTPTGIDAETRQRVAAIDASLDRIHSGPESDS